MTLAHKCDSWDEKKEGIDYYIPWKYFTRETFFPKNHLEAGEFYEIFL